MNWIDNQVFERFFTTFQIFHNIRARKQNRKIIFKRLRFNSIDIFKILRMSKKFISVCLNICSHCRQFHLNTKMPVKYITMCRMLLSLATDSLHFKCQGAKLFARASCVFCHTMSMHSFISFIWDCSFWLHCALFRSSQSMAHCPQHCLLVCHIFAQKI